MAVTRITSYNGSKLGLSTDKINKWLREALYNKHSPSTRDQTAVWNYTTKVIVELQGGDFFGGPGSHPKNIIKQT